MKELDSDFKEKVMLAANSILWNDPLSDVFSEHDIHWLIQWAAAKFESEVVGQPMCPDCELPIAAGGHSHCYLGKEDKR